MDEGTAGYLLRHWKLHVMHPLGLVSLDNAIHACERPDIGTEKYIRVSGRIQGDFLMIEVENSFHGKGRFKEGTGLSNVKAVVESCP